MDLILWRHAEAELAHPDREDALRKLTLKGQKQAHKMAYWLDSQLPETCRILVSPTIRTRQTADAILALNRKIKIVSEASPESSVEDLLKISNWPTSREPILIVGHQPNLGELVERIMAPAFTQCSIRKGNVWWISQKERDGEGIRTYLKAIISPDLVIK
jgi:phosphohistidine phosphatase